jgi:sugar O-acyltransferase (sialic acid O-acetyltransferase NeuD family)
MILVVGTGGLSKQCIHVLEEKGQELVFFDDTENSPSDFFGHQVITNLYEIADEEGFDFVIGIGNPKWREHFHRLLIENYPGFPINIVSKNQLVSPEATYGLGNIILDYSLIEAHAKIGSGNLINTYASIHHDVIIGDFNEIMPGSKILGNVKIGNQCRIGTNSSILPGVEICDNVIIGAGAVVNKSITEPGTYVGIPARKIK